MKRLPGFRFDSKAGRAAFDDERHSREELPEGQRFGKVVKLAGGRQRGGPSERPSEEAIGKAAEAPDRVEMISIRELVNSAALARRGRESSIPHVPKELLVSRAGLEPATPCLKGRCSNRLS